MRGLCQRERIGYSKVTKKFRDFCHRDKVNGRCGQNFCTSQLIIFIIAISKLGFRARRLRQIRSYRRRESKVELGYNAFIATREIIMSSINSPNFASPYSDGVPADSFQFSLAAGISGNVALNLLLQELDIGLWQPEILASLMTMPKTTVNENDGLILRQNNIRIARQFSDLYTEPQAS